MKGFIVRGVSTYYEQVIQLLERAVLTGWSDGHATFYRFGSRIAPVRGRAHLEALQPGFYTDPEYFQRTLIENVVDFANSQNLTILVTDLFQNEADVNLLTAKLKDKYLANNLAVGVLGIKSQFEGMVYDVGLRNYSFQYSSGNSKAERFRPFYILMLGNHADVERYYEALRTSGLEGFPLKNFIIFSRYLANPLGSFANARLTSTSKIVEVGGLLAAGVKDNRAKQFRVRNNSAKASFAVALKYFPLHYTTEFNPASLEPEVTAWKHQSNQLSESAPAKQSLAINGVTLSGDELRTGIEITPSLLPADGIYCFRVTLRPREYSLPSWISDWDMPPAMIEDWKRNTKNFNGAMTFNLKPFLEGIWKAVVQLHRPKIGEIYYYLEKG